MMFKFQISCTYICTHISTKDKNKRLVVLTESFSTLELYNSAIYQEGGHASFLAFAIMAVYLVPIVSCLGIFSNETVSH